MLIIYSPLRFIRLWLKLNKWIYLGCSQLGQPIDIREGSSQVQTGTCASLASI